MLALVLRQLCTDWHEAYGHPVVIVENFVDESWVRGTHYRACGFQSLGLTGGFARTARDFYVEHGKPKVLYLRALAAWDLAVLRRARLPEALRLHEGNQAGLLPFQTRPCRRYGNASGACRNPAAAISCGSRKSGRLPAWRWMARPCVAAGGATARTCSSLRRSPTACA